MFGEVKNSKYKKIAICLVLSLILLYCIENSFLLNKIGSTPFIYGIKPSYFMILFLLLCYKIPKIHLAGKTVHRSTVYIWAFNCGMIYITINILGGLVQGFGKSPYSHTLTGILSNIIIIGIELAGRESIRSYMVSSYMRRNNKWILASVILIMTLTNIRFLGFTEIADMKGLVVFCAETLLPEFCNNVLATYLALYGGACASAIYLGVIKAALWFSPILPSLNWLGKGVIGMIIPIFCLIYITNSYLTMTKGIKIYKEKQKNVWVWIPETVGAVLFIWFIVGVFSIYPSVIATGSMKPLINPGDVIVLEKMKDIKDIEALGIGDVIQFKRENILITHRIVEVLKKDGTPAFRTKGDNNSVEDSEIVRAEDVKGSLKKVVPKVGWPTLILKSSNPNVIDDVEF